MKLVQTRNTNIFIEYIKNIKSQYLFCALASQKNNNNLKLLQPTFVLFFWAENKQINGKHFARLVAKKILYYSNI